MDDTASTDWGDLFKWGIGTYVDLEKSKSAPVTVSPASPAGDTDRYVRNEDDATVRAGTSGLFGNIDQTTVLIGLAAVALVVIVLVVRK